jgi:L-lactate utilization protein LutB
MADRDELRALMESEGAAVSANTRGFNRGRYESVSRLNDYESLKTEARAIKEDGIKRLPELVEELRETVEENGGTVYIADDTADANEYVRSVVAERDAHRVVKSKSMTSEEIEVNEALEKDGVDVVKTDLGEWVLQVADETPSHIVAPAIHKSREAIAALFNEHFDPEAPLETAEELTAFARERLGELIEGADVGMTGANFITADTGTIALVTSEGNARKTVVSTDTQLAVAGAEKVIPTVEDLHPFVELIGRSGTGQDITSYVSLLTLSVETPTFDFADDETPLSELDSDREFHRAHRQCPDGDVRGRRVARDPILHPVFCLLELLCELPAGQRARLRRGDVLGGHRHRVGGRHRGTRHRRGVQRPLYRLFALRRRPPRKYRHPVDQHGRARPDQPGERSL